MISSGPIQDKRFQWQTTAEATLNVITKIIHI